MGKGNRTRRRRGKEDFAVSKALAKATGGFVDPKVGSVEAPNTEEGTEEAIAEVLKVAQEQGCTCTVKVQLEVLAEDPARQTRESALHLFHEEHCPLLRNLQEGSR